MANENVINNPAPNAPAKEVVTWHAPEFQYLEKSKKWYIIVISAAVVIAGIFGFLGYYLSMFPLYLGAIAVVLAPVALIKNAFVKPRIIKYSITEQGVEIKNRPHPYSMFKSFLVVENPGDNLLYLYPKKRFSMPVTVHLADLSTKDVTTIIGRYLPLEKEAGEHWSDQLFRLFGG